MVSATRETATQRHWTCGRRLRERRHALGLTQAELVDRLGGGPALTNRSISTWENGRGLDFGWLPELAAALDCSVTYLLGLTDDPRGWEPAVDPVPIRVGPATSDATVVPASAPAPAPASEPAPSASETTHNLCNWILGPGPMPADDLRPSRSRSSDTP